jgi:hypothetical protein
MHMQLQFFKGSPPPRVLRLALHARRYLNRVDAAMDALKRTLGEQPITMLSHSVSAAAPGDDGNTQAACWQAAKGVCQVHDPLVKHEGQKNHIFM